MGKKISAAAEAYNAATKEERHAHLRARNEELGDDVKPPHDKHADKQGDAEEQEEEETE